MLFYEKINADIFTILGILKTEHVKHIREKYYYKYCGILCWLKKQRCNRQAVILTVKTSAVLSLWQSVIKKIIDNS